MIINLKQLSVTTGDEESREWQARYVRGMSEAVKRGGDIHDEEYVIYLGTQSLEQY